MGQDAAGCDYEVTERNKSEGKRLEDWKLLDVTGRQEEIGMNRT